MANNPSASSTIDSNAGNNSSHSSDGRRFDAVPSLEASTIVDAVDLADIVASTLDDDEDFDEDRAPSDFNVASAHELLHGDHSDPWSGCVMRCTLCASSRRSFHCRDCVQNGNFMHTMSARMGECFADKRTRYESLQQRHRDLTERAEALLEPRRRRESLEARLTQSRLQVATMQAEVERRRRQLDESQRLHRRLSESIEGARKKFPQFENNVENLRHFVEDRLAQNGRLEEQRADLQRTLQQRVRRLIGGLVTYVFPITQVMSRSAVSAEMAAHTATTTSSAAQATAAAEVPEHVSALAEATRTAYVRGRWVLQDSQHELHHMVVAPSLPGNGDYSAYVDWIASNRDGVPGGGGAQGGGGGAVGLTQGGASGVASGEVANTSQNDAYRIAAALTYTTQMVNLLGFYLDVHLPYRMNYGDFCNKELTAGSFQRKVARLNGNILALCYSQNVKAHRLVATHTLANLQHLLGADDLGRCGAVDVSNSLVTDVAHLNADLQAGGDDSDSDDENTFPHEWEAVPHLSPHETFTVSPTPSSLPPTPASLLSMTTQQTTSMAGGLVNNAVASVTSIWRGFTGR